LLLLRQQRLLYAENKMAEFQQEALFINIYRSDFKDALILMVNYVIERKITLFCHSDEGRISAIVFF
jgi:hypothetical protein